MFDHLHHLLPQTSDWFSSNLEYKGRGIALFSNPKGYIKGEAICRYDQTGECIVEMTIEDWSNEDASNAENRNLSFVWLINGFKPQETMGNGIMFIPLNRNICESLEIQTADGGIFKANLPYIDNRETHTGHIIKFVPSSAEFRTSNEEAAKYWAMPLLNFTGQPWFNSLIHWRDLREHPLRIRPLLQKTIDFLTSDAQTDEKNFVEFATASMSHIIRFEYCGQLGFIERLPNYEDIEQDLTNCKIRTAQTAIMVSEKQRPDEFDPIDLLPVLGIATGSPVGAAWLEFRDESGVLVYRLHENFGRPRFEGNRFTVHEAIHSGGIGKLLSAFSASDHYGKTEVRVAMNHASQIFSSSDATERIYYIATALNLLCNYFNVETLIARDRDHLSPDQLNEINAILDQTRNSILGIKHKPKDKEQTEALNRIANNAKRIPLSPRINFADLVVALMRMKEFNLHDMDVVDQFYSTDDEWKKIVNIYRNATAHEGYYSKQGRPDRDKEISVPLVHLHDILLRILLKLTNYDGGYASCFYGPNSDDLLDWVQPAIPPSELGYHK